MDYCKIVSYLLPCTFVSFRDISVKMPGSVHDASVLRASNLYKNVANLPQVKVYFKAHF